MNNLHLWRYLLFLAALVLALTFVAAVVVSFFGLTGDAFYWASFGARIVGLLSAFVVAQLAIRRGQPRWLFKNPPPTV